MRDTADAARRNFPSQAMPLSLVLRNGGSLLVYAVMVTTEYSGVADYTDPVGGVAPGG